MHILNLKLCELKIKISAKFLLFVVWISRDDKFMVSVKLYRVVMM